MAKITLAKDIKNNRLDKQAESKKRSKVYNTEIINLIIKDLASGGEPDMAPFWHGLTDYRDLGIAYEYTDHELAELEKCAGDAIYFIENYCKFLNDKGRTIVKLRDYQKRLINLMASEKYDDVSDIIVPKNPRIVVMQSRQTGKCVTGDTLIYVPDNIMLDFSLLSFISYIKRKWKQLINSLSCFHWK